MRVLVRRLRHSESGQNLVEWALLIAFAAIGSLAFMNQSGGSVSGIWTTANLALQGQSRSSVTQSQSGSTGGTGSTSNGGDSGYDGDHRHDGDGH